jgi:sugar lactone lactonase YvrE
MTGEPYCVVPAGDWCGEGPLWNPDEQALYWVDINRFLIHRLDPATDAVKTWMFDEPVTALALTDCKGTLAVALGSRPILWTPATDSHRDHGFRLPSWPAVRFNDGGVDPRGSFWAGTMRNNVNPDGSPGEAGGTDGVLYRIDPDGGVSEWKRGIGISNTFAWSPDATRFYFGDTLLNQVFVYDYDASTGVISNERPFFGGFERGHPDGSAMDSAGFLWNCRWGGSCIVRVAPDGSIDRVIEMPARNISCCAFGGPDLKTVYATTAALENPHPDRLAGSLFALRSDVPGLPANRFRVVGR